MSDSNIIFDLENVPELNKYDLSICIKASRRYKKTYKYINGTLQQEMYSRKIDQSRKNHNIILSSSQEIWTVLYHQYLREVVGRNAFTST